VFGGEINQQASTMLCRSSVGIQRSHLLQERVEAIFQDGFRSTVNYHLVQHDMLGVFGNATPSSRSNYRMLIKAS
jgi:hypothetical protein